MILVLNEFMVEKGWKGSDAMYERHDYVMIFNHGLVKVLKITR